MKKQLIIVRKILVYLFLLISAMNFAQEERPGQPIGGIVVKGGKNPGGNLLISLGGGGLFPGKTYSESSHTGNAFNGNVNLYVPVFTLSNAEMNYTSLGVNGGVGFFGMKKESQTEGRAYNVSGQSSLPSLRTGIANGSRQNGFIGEAGIQSNISFNKFTLSPILNLAYISLKGNESSTVQTSNVNGQTRSFETFKSSTSNTDGLGVIPKLRLSYFPGRLGFFVEGSYIAGPNVHSTTKTFIPNGSPNSEGFTLSSRKKNLPLG